jgi:hypothetical protein
MNTNNINQIFQKVLKNLSFVGVGLGMFNTVNNLITNKALRDNLEDERIKNSQLIERVNNLVEGNESNSKLENIIRKSFENNENKIEALNSKMIQIIESKSSEENIVIEVNNSMKEINKDLSDVINQIDESLRSNIIDLELFNSIITYINNLNFHQTLAFTHICAIMFIFLSLNSLIALYFGDYLSNKFNIDTKYPRIYKFIELRRKFQVYFLIKDLIIIYITLILLTLINILLFITFS